ETRCFSLAEREITVLVVIALNERWVYTGRPERFGRMPIVGSNGVEVDGESQEECQCLQSV
ncbi:MAG TPA: hypothetical protein VEK07_11115, partial [Polyangiaceae bacterium]|nr:hypothetical protein [Polyangiaceae bacterium]